MKLVSAILLIVCMFFGCSAQDKQLDNAMNLRKSILEADSCAFQAVITADYGEIVYTFQMDCTVDQNGNLQFTVIDPEAIAGITGTLSQDSAALTFDDKVLAFPILADGQLTPVSAPWIFIHTLRSGYLTGCSKEDVGICIYIDDSFEENPLHLEIYTDDDAQPIRAEIIWQDRRVLSMDIRNFTFL